MCKCISTVQSSINSNFKDFQLFMINQIVMFTEIQPIHTSDISNIIQTLKKFQSGISNSNFSNAEVKGASFVLVLNYYEQLTCATRNLFIYYILFKVAQNFDAKVIIPSFMGVYCGGRRATVI